MLPLVSSDLLPGHTSRALQHHPDPRFHSQRYQGPGQCDNARALHKPINNSPHRSHLLRVQRLLLPRGTPPPHRSQPLPAGHPADVLLEWRLGLPKLRLLQEYQFRSKRLRMPPEQGTVGGEAFEEHISRGRDIDAFGTRICLDRQRLLVAL